MKGFRTLEISEPSELHAKSGQLEITQGEKVVHVPIEDLTTITCIGSNIRLSTMCMSVLAENGVTLMTLNSKYNPACIVAPIESNVRQSKVLHHQVNISEVKKFSLWQRIIRCKIENQSRALSIMGLSGADKVMFYTEDLTAENIDVNEAAAAKEYFYNYHPGLNRRNDDPINSRLNYGYAVVRNAIIRELLLTGLQPALGIHHNNQFNTFNLADDLIEPWRPFVDLIAHDNIGSSVNLSRTERKELASVLHSACIINESKLSVLAGIHAMVVGIKNSIESETLIDFPLPTVIPIEPMDEIKE